MTISTNNPEPRRSAIDYRDTEKIDGLLRALTDTATETARLVGVRGTPAEAGMAFSARSHVHRAVIDAFIRSGDTETTRAYYGNAKDEPQPGDAERLAPAIDTMAVTDTARAQATLFVTERVRSVRSTGGDDLVMPGMGGNAQPASLPSPSLGADHLDPGALLAEAASLHAAATRRNQTVNARNPERQRATQQELDIQLAQRQRQIEDSDLQLNQAVDS